MSPALALAVLAVGVAVLWPGGGRLWHLAAGLCGVQLAVTGHLPAGLCLLTAAAVAAVLGRRDEPVRTPDFQGLLRIVGAIALGVAGGLALTPRVASPGRVLATPDVFALGFVLATAAAAGITAPSRTARSRALQLVVAAMALAWVGFGGDEATAAITAIALPALAAVARPQPLKASP